MVTKNYLKYDPIGISEQGSDLLLKLKQIGVFCFSNNALILGITNFSIRSIKSVFEIIFYPFRSVLMCLVGFVLQLHWWIVLFSHRQRNQEMCC